MIEKNGREPSTKGRKILKEVSTKGRKNPKSKWEYQSPSGRLGKLNLSVLFTYSRRAIPVQDQ